MLSHVKVEYLVQNCKLKLLKVLRENKSGILFFMEWFPLLTKILFSKVVFSEMLQICALEVLFKIY